MDGLLHELSTIHPGPPQQNAPSIGTGNPGAEFVATATETKGAIEGKMTDGLTHGVRAPSSVALDFLVRTWPKTDAAVSRVAGPARHHMSGEEAPRH